MIYLIADSSETVDFEVWYILTARLKEHRTKPDFLTDIRDSIEAVERFCQFRKLEEHNTDIERVFWYECRHRVKLPLPEVVSIPCPENIDLYTSIIETWEPVLEPAGFKDITISDYLSKEVDNCK